MGPAEIRIMAVLVAGIAIVLMGSAVLQERNTFGEALVVVGALVLVAYVTFKATALPTEDDKG